MGDKMASVSLAFVLSLWLAGLRSVTSQNAYGAYNVPVCCMTPKCPYDCNAVPTSADSTSSSLLNNPLIIFAIVIGCLLVLLLLILLLWMCCWCCCGQCRGSWGDCCQGGCWDCWGCFGCQCCGRYAEDDQPTVVRRVVRVPRKQAVQPVVKKQLQVVLPPPTVARPVQPRVSDTVVVVSPPQHQEQPQSLLFTVNDGYNNPTGGPSMTTMVCRPLTFTLTPEYGASSTYGSQAYDDSILTAPVGEYSHAGHVLN